MRGAHKILLDTVSAQNPRYGKGLGAYRHVLHPNISDAQDFRTAIKMFRNRRGPACPLSANVCYRESRIIMTRTSLHAGGLEQGGCS